MGRHSHHEHSGSQFEGTHPGCMWGILHILDYHHWHLVRKMLPHRKHRRGRHTRCNGSPTENLYDYTGEVQAYVDSETEHLLVKQHATKETFKEKNQKRRIRGFPARSQLGQTDPIHQPSEHQHFCDISPDWTKPITLLHSSTDPSAVRSLNLSLPKKEYLPEKCNQVTEASVNNEALHHQLKECVDVLEMFKVNKELFLEILQDADVGIAKHFNVLQTPDAKEIFAKSRSFPVADSSRVRNVTPSTLKHKQSEIWSFPKGEKSVATMPPKNYNLQQKTLVADDNVGSATKQESSFFSLGLGHALNHQGRRQLLVNIFKDIKQKIKHALKEIKKESHHSSKDAVFPQIPNESRLSADAKEASESLESTSGQDGTDVPRSCLENEVSDYEFSKGRLHNIRKPSSLNESLDKYARLFEYSFSKEPREHRSKSLRLRNEEKVPLRRHAPRSYRRNLSMPDLESFCSLLNEVSRDVLSSGISVGTFVDPSTDTENNNNNDPNSASIHINTDKVQPPEYVGHCSKSLRLTNEEKVPLRRHAPRSFRRNLSMPDLESFCSLLNEVSRDVLFSGMAVGTSVDHSTDTENNNNSDQNSASIHINADKVQPPESLVETEFQRNKVELSNRSASIKYPAGLGEDIVDLILMESSPHQGNEIPLTMNSSSEFAQPGPVSVPETCFPDSETNPAELPIIEGSELNPTCNHLDEPHCSVNLQNRTNTDSSPGFPSTVNLECVKNHFLHFELDLKDDADFNYVKDVVELSGFIGNESLGTWHSLDEPLNPLLFEKLEACFPHELECSEEEVGGGSSDRQLLFDVVNEAIVDIYERSFSYFPKALSFGCSIHPMPIGQHFLGEVWARIKSSRPEVEQPLDYIMAQDLSKGDGWMNLQLETECVAIELEELIFEELLDEVFCS